MRQELDAALGQIKPSKSQKPIPASPAPGKSVLDDKAIEILQVITAGGEVHREGLQLEFHLPKAKIDYYLDTLKEEGLISIGGPFSFGDYAAHVSSTAKGRKELVDRGLL